MHKLNVSVIKGMTFILIYELVKKAFFCSHAKAIINCREALKAGIVHYTSQLTGISEGDTQIDQEWKEILNILCSILSLSKT